MSEEAKQLEQKPFKTLGQDLKDAIKDLPDVKSISNPILTIYLEKENQETLSKIKEVMGEIRYNIGIVNSGKFFSVK